jgi:hypothetical protein
MQRSPLSGKYLKLVFAAFLFITNYSFAQVDTTTNSTLPTGASTFSPTWARAFYGGKMYPYLFYSNKWWQVATSQYVKGNYARLSGNNILNGNNTFHGTTSIDTLKIYPTHSGGGVNYILGYDPTSHLVLESTTGESAPHWFGLFADPAGIISYQGPTNQSDYGYPFQARLRAWGLSSPGGLASLQITNTSLGVNTYNLRGLSGSGSGSNTYNVDLPVKSGQLTVSTDIRDTLIAKTITINGTTKTLDSSPSFTIAGGVTDFNGRTGSIIPQSSDYSAYYEVLTNKSTNTSLGTSNTLYPTQNAVKAYVDNAVSGIPAYTASNGVIKVGNDFRSDTTYNRTVNNSFTKSQTNTQIANAISAYVPYAGATKNVSLNSKSLKSVDTLSSSHLYAKTGINQGDSIWVTPTKRFYFFGDSYTAYVGPTSNDLAYTRMVSRGINLKEINLGIPGTTMQQLSAGDSSMYNRINRIPTYNSTTDSYISFMYGVNDYRNSPGNGADTSTFKTQYIAVLNRAITTNGWPVGKVFITEPQYQNNAFTATQRNNWLTAFNRVAAAFPGINIIKIQNDLVSTGRPGYYFNADSLHENNLGHERLAKLYLLKLTDAKMPNYFTHGRIVSEQSLNIYRNSGDSVLVNIQDNSLPAFSITSNNTHMVRIGSGVNASTKFQLSLGNSITGTSNDFRTPKLLFYGDGLGSSNYVGIDYNTTDGWVFQNNVSKLLDVRHTVFKVDSNIIVGGTSNFTGQITAASASFSGTVNANTITRQSTTTGMTFNTPEGTTLPYSATFSSSNFTNVANLGHVRFNGTFAPTTGATGWAEVAVTPTINVTGTATGPNYGVRVNPTLTAGGSTFRAYQADNTQGYGFYSSGNIPNYFGGSVQLGGSTSGVISIQTQAAAGTYNFNLPTTAGTTGQVLTSQGGGATAMTWTSVSTPLRLTASGNGSSTTISIAHGLSGVSSSSIATVSPINAASAGISYITTDATNINIVYTVAPASGSNNLAYNIFIKP